MTEMKQAADAGAMSVADIGAFLDAVNGRIPAVFEDGSRRIAYDGALFTVVEGDTAVQYPYLLTMEITGAGTKEFGKTTYTEVGTYVYEITEVKGNAEGYTYDTAVYTLTVEVTEGADGNLVAKETYVDANGKVVKSATATFTNTYTPKPPVLPQTSDDSVPTSTLVAVAGTGFALLLAGLSLRLRRNEE